MKLEFDRQGEVRAVVVRGPTGRSGVPNFEYSVLGIEQIAAGVRAMDEAHAHAAPASVQPCRNR